MARDYNALAKSIEYFDEIGKELYKLECRVKAIKQSEEYKARMNVMSVYASRGIIETAPNFKNGYKTPNVIEIKGDVVKKENFLKKFLDEKE